MDRTRRENGRLFRTPTSLENNVDVSSLILGARGWPCENVDDGRLFRKQRNRNLGVRVLILECVDRMRDIPQLITLLWQVLFGEAGRPYGTEGLP